MTLLKMQCIGFSELKSPLTGAGVRNYYANVNVDSIQDALWEWRGINVRDPKDTGRVPDAISSSLFVSPLFPFMNRGLTIAADSVKYDGIGEMSISLTNPRIHGLLDGGHTLLQLRKFIGTPKEGRELQVQHVRVEIITGMPAGKIVDVVSGRNNSNSVKPVSLEDLRGSFDWIKAALKGYPYSELISYSEHELTRDGVKKPIRIEDVISPMICLDYQTNGKDKHPSSEATRANEVVEYFSDNYSALKMLRDILPDILRLDDFIKRDFVQACGRIPGILKRFCTKRKTPLYFLGEESRSTFNASTLRRPILSVLRLILIERNGLLLWKEDPFLLMQEVLPSIASIIVNGLKVTRSSANLVRSAKTWSDCMNQVGMLLLDRSHKRSRSRLKQAGRG